MSANKLHLIIHGHFYQPPREEPWTLEIERQDSAYPFHDWNERINKECYAANAASRILDSSGRIVQIINNYQYISFNIGPTLMSWIKRKDFLTYQRIVDADKESVLLNKGHGNAIAQVYNHIIMPLANDRDVITQIEWGLQSFEQDFGRKAEGIWLSETAVNDRIAEFLISYGIKFIILSPTQAKEVKSLHESDSAPWKDVSDNAIDPSKPYLLRESNGTIAVFFYYGDIATKISFQHLLRNVDYLRGEFIAHNNTHNPDHLVHVATDGESYGHHEPFGDMCLSRLIYDNFTRNDFRLTNYGYYLEIHPPQDAVRLKSGNDNLGTAWSCAHGVDRWRKDCGCSTGGGEGWNQKWREHFRVALDFLRDRIYEAAEKALSPYLEHVWIARNQYYPVVLAQSQDERKTALEAFFRQHLKSGQNNADTSFIIRIMEALHNELLMYTSCGWFFSEISGIETVQDMKYAARIFELAEDILPEDTHEKFLSILSHAKSNITDLENGKWIFENFAEKGTFTDCHAQNEYLLSLVLNQDKVTLNATEFFYYYGITIQNYQVKEKEGWTIYRFKTRMSNRLFWEVNDYVAYIFKNGIEVKSYIKKTMDDSLGDYLDKVLEKGTPRSNIKDFHDWFNRSYGLSDLTYDAKERLLKKIFEKKMAELHHFMGHNTEKLEDYLDAVSLYQQLGVKIPDKDRVAIRELLNNSILDELEKIEEFDMNHYDFTFLTHVIQIAKRSGIKLDYADILPLIRNYVLNRMHKAIVELNAKELINLEKVIDFTNLAGIDFEKYEIQNLFYERLNDFTREGKKSALSTEVLHILFRLAGKFNLFTEDYERALLK